MTLNPKALTGLTEGRVRPALAPVREYHVESASRPGVRHSVFVGAHTQYCTCEHKGPRRCWHLDAVIAREHASLEELAVMNEAIELAKQRERVAGEDAFANL